MVSNIYDILQRDSMPDISMLTEHLESDRRLYRQRLAEQDISHSDALEQCILPG